MTEQPPTVELICSFCGTPRSQTRRMVLSENTQAVICEVCVSECVHLLVHADDEVLRKPGDAVSPS